MSTIVSSRISDTVQFSQRTTVFNPLPRSSYLPCHIWSDVERCSSVSQTNQRSHIPNLSATEETRRLA